MKSLIIVVLFLIPYSGFAQDAGEEYGPHVEIGEPIIVKQQVPIVITAPTVDGGTSTTTVTTTVSTTTADPFANPLGSGREFVLAIKKGNYWLAAALALFCFIGLLRLGGKKIHEFIPDTNPLDLPFFFLFDTKIGGWLMNWLTSIGLVLGGSYAAGVVIDMDTWKTAVLISTSGTAVIELWKDIKQWWAARKVKEATLSVAPADVPPPPKPTV